MKTRDTKKQENKHNASEVMTVTKPHNHKMNAGLE